MIYASLERRHSQHSFHISVVVIGPEEAEQQLIQFAPDNLRESLLTIKISNRSSKYQRSNGARIIIVRSLFFYRKLTPSTVQVPRGTQEIAH